MHCYPKTNIGKTRKANEDSYACVSSADDIIQFCMVADGMGGHLAGEVASDIAATEFKRYFSSKKYKGKKIEELKRVLKKQFVEISEIIDKKIIELSRENPDEYNGMGTTAVMCAAFDEGVVIANIGDSRAYVIHKNKPIEQITEDDSFVHELLLTGKITPEEAKNHPKKNAITKALGFLRGDTPTVYSYEIMDGDRFLLCSDGLCNMLSDEEIDDIFKKTSFVSMIPRNLVSEANRKGGTDNITVIVIIPKKK